MSEDKGYVKEIGHSYPQTTSKAPIKDVINNTLLSMNYQLVDLYMNVVQDGEGRDMPTVVVFYRPLSCIGGFPVAHQDIVIPHSVGDFYSKESFAYLLTALKDRIRKTDQIRTGFADNPPQVPGAKLEEIASEPLRQNQ